MPPTSANGTFADHQHRQFRRGKRQVEQHEDKRDRDRNDQHQAARRAFLVFELAAVFDEVPGRKRDFAVDSRPDLRDEAAQIAPAYVRHDNDAPLAFFSIDDFRTAAYFDARDLFQRHLFAAGSAQWNLSHGVRIGAISFGKAQRDGISLLPVDHFRDHVAGPAARNRLLDIRDVQAVARQRGSVHADRQLGDARRDFHLRIRRSADGRHRAQHLLADAYRAAGNRLRTP